VGGAHKLAGRAWLYFFNLFNVENYKMTEKPKTCQVCRMNPAVVKSSNSKGAPQWRCQTCHDLKNRAGFTKGKQ